MHVLLTRPLEDSIDLIKRFKDKDITVSHLPLIKINKLDYPKLKSSEYNVIVFTSSNAIRNLDTKDFSKNILCFCVGDATEKTAKQKGFHNTFSAGGNVRNLQFSGSHRWRFPLFYVLNQQKRECQETIISITIFFFSVGI